MRVRLIFAWYDLWVGAYWDRRSRQLYILPLPCAGIVLDFGSPRLDYVRRAAPVQEQVIPSAFGPGRASRRRAIHKGTAWICPSCHRYEIAPGGGLCPKCGWVK